MPEQESELDIIRRSRLHLEMPRMAEPSQDGNLDVQRSSLDDAVAKSSSEIGNSATATLGSVGKMGKRDDFLSVPGSYQRSLKRPRVEEKEKETKAVRDKELKALEVKIKALEEKWVTNRE
ncbi:hypothetical protein DER46DRAFT_568428 [Fusarium sp. MPI-SDFR-AT-0072]|nr:hypothetical protein DER46DRAFT_568428 [Fusarium sp. MPI-SDFR-AT-0072]